MRKKASRPYNYHVPLAYISEVRREAGKCSGAARREKGPKMPVRTTAIYAEDYVTLMRYSRQESRLRADILHELIAPLKEKIKGLPRVDPNDPWLQKPEEDY